MPVSPLKPIRHAELRGGLQSVVRPLENEQRDWTGGISFNQSCDVLGGGASCTDPATEKTSTILGDPVTFNPFLVYNLQECIGLGRVDGLGEISLEHLRRTENRNIALQLHDARWSDPGSPDPSLQSAASDETPVTIPDLKAALIGIVQATTVFGIGEIVIHAPLKVMPAMLSQHLVVWNQASLRYEMGHIPVVFDVYPNIGPDAAGNDVPADTDAWLYVSGPIEVARGQVQAVKNFDQQRNEHLDRQERLAILRFDPCSVAAVKATIC